MSVLESLVVLDPETRSRDALAFAFERDGCAVHATHDAREALALAETRVPQVVVASMAAGVDVGALLAALRGSRRSHDLPALVIGDAAMREAIRGAGADDFLARPAFLRDVVVMARLLAARREREESADLEDFEGLLGLSRALHFARRSGVLTVERRGRHGELRLCDGELVGARVGQQSGANAFHSMLLWDSGGLTFLRNERSKPEEFGEPARSIHKPMERLLDDGARFIAQFEEIVAKMGGARAVYRQEARQLALVKRKLPAEVMPLIERFDGRRTIAEVVEESSFKPFDALMIVFRLSELGAIAVRESGAAGSVVKEWLSGEAGGEEVAVGSELRRLAAEVKEPPDSRESPPIGLRREPSDGKLVGRPPAAVGRVALPRLASDRTPPPIPIDAPRTPPAPAEEMAHVATDSHPTHRPPVHEKVAPPQHSAPQSSPSRSSLSQPSPPQSLFPLPPSSPPPSLPPSPSSPSPMSQSSVSQLPASQLSMSQLALPPPSQPHRGSPDFALPVDGSIQQRGAAVEPHRPVLTAKSSAAAVVEPSPSATILAANSSASVVDQTLLSSTIVTAPLAPTIDAARSASPPSGERAPALSPEFPLEIASAALPSPSPVAASQGASSEPALPVEEVRWDTGRRRRSAASGREATSRHRRVTGPHPKAAVDDSQALTNRAARRDTGRIKKSSDPFPRVEASDANPAEEPREPARTSLAAESGAGSRANGEEVARSEPTGRHRRARVAAPSLEAERAAPSERQGAELNGRESSALPPSSAREPARRDATGPKQKLGFDPLEEDFFAREADLAKIDAIDNFEDLGEPTTDEPRRWFGKRPPGRRRR